jgi:hypothetical protein
MRLWKTFLRQIAGRKRLYQLSSPARFLDALVLAMRDDLPGKADDARGNHLTQPALIVEP